MATENHMPEAQERELRLNRELGELELAIENLDPIDLREWMADRGYLLPTERNEMVQRNNDQLLELAAIKEGRSAHPLQTS